MIFMVGLDLINKDQLDKQHPIYSAGLLTYF